MQIRKLGRKFKSKFMDVLVFSSRSLVRKGVISHLSGEDDIRLKGEASNVMELIECLDKIKPNIVIINDDDEEVSILEAINLVNQMASHVKILLLLKDYDEDKEVAALKMGVRGFLPERAGKDDIVKCIKAINDGEMWVRRKVMERLIKQLLITDTGIN
ncbi:MAG: hypothetical protein ACT4NX_10240 [Deltaproteobacteria bacterium]